MRGLYLLAGSAVLLAACNDSVTVPSDSVFYEVPQGGTASSAGGYVDPSYYGPAYGSEVAVANDPVVAGGPGGDISGLGSASGTGAALDDDRINLMQWTLEQQKIDAAIAERDLEAARSQLVVVQPTAVPTEPAGVNIALFAQQSTNAVGERVYPRSAGARVSGIGSCGRYRDGDAAQRAFLAAGGPVSDRSGLDPDGDGFACNFDPAPYRALR